MANGDRTHANCAPVIPGAQAIHRAAALLKQVACENAVGITLQELCVQLGIGMPTAHRILKALIAEGLIVKDASTGRYRLGPVTYELGLAAVPRADIRVVCLPSLQRLAAKTGDTAYLFVRSDLDGVCLERSEGSFPLRVLTLEVGMRRPLGVSAGSVALLMGLPSEQARSILRANSKRFAQFDIDLDTASRSLVEANLNGFSMNDELTTRGQKGFAVPCFGEDGAPIASISIAAINARMTRTRIKEILPLLKEEVARIERYLTRREATLHPVGVGDAARRRD